MAQHYAAETVGVLDGTQIPANRFDGRVVGAKKSSIMATKVTGTAWASGDTVVLGKLPAGAKLVGIKCTTDTSFATATVSIGNASSANKYVNAATLTATDVPTVLGPQATAMDDAPLDAEEEVIATIGTASIAAGTIATFELEYVSVK